MKPCFRCKSNPRRGGAAYCRPCSSLVMREWRARNPERNRENGKRNDQRRWSTNIAKYTTKRRERHLRWREANPEEYREQYIQKYRRTRARAVSKLGGTCACCGERRSTMLHVDHIHNDGYKEGRGRRSYSLMRRVLKADDPSLKYQILCANCNHSKARNGGTCEHKTNPAPEAIGWCVA